MCAFLSVHVSRCYFNITDNNSVLVFNGLKCSCCVSPRLPVVCQNLVADSLCDEWWADGQCGLNAPYMYKYCWKSCMQCDGPPGRYREWGVYTVYKDNYLYTDNTWVLLVRLYSCVHVSDRICVLVWQLYTICFCAMTSFMECLHTKFVYCKNYVSID